MFHFEENSKRANSSKEAIKELNKYLRGYDKSLNYNRILYKKTETAIRNSQNKEKQQESVYDWSDAECNPRSDMHKLVKLIDEGA